MRFFILLPQCILGQTDGWLDDRPFVWILLIAQNENKTMLYWLGSMCWMCNKVVSIFWIENDYDNQQRRDIPWSGSFVFGFYFYFFFFDITFKRQTNQPTNWQWIKMKKKKKHTRKKKCATRSCYCFGVLTTDCWNSFRL